MSLEGSTSTVRRPVIAAPRRWPRPWAPPAGQAPAAGPASPGTLLTPPRTTRATRRRYLTGALWVIGLAVAAVVGRAALPELQDAMRAMGGAHRGWLIVALALEIAALAVLPLPFRGALNALGGRADYRELLDATLGAFALSRVVPAGGLAGGAYAVRRIVGVGNTAPVAVAAVTAASAITMLSLGVVVVGGATLDAVAGRGSAGVARGALSALAAVVVAGAGVAWLLRRPARLDRLSTRLSLAVRRPDVAHGLRRQIAVVRPLLADPVPLARVAGWAVVNWAMQLAALWTVFLAFGLSMPIGVLIVGFGAANLATALPHTPGGLGVVEAGMTATYVALGVPTATALVGVVCYRLIGHWLPVLAALPLVIPRVRQLPGQVGS